MPIENMSFYRVKLSFPIRFIVTRNINNSDYFVHALCHLSAQIGYED